VGITAIGALITAIVAIYSIKSDKKSEERNMSEWKGSVDAKLSHFEKFMQNIERKLEQIFLRLPPLLVSKKNLHLTDLG